MKMSERKQNARGLPSALRRVGYAADIHLNFLDFDQRPVFYKKVRELSLDGLLLVGDTSIGSMLVDDLNELAENLKIPVWFVLGNHCWWMAKTATLRMRLQAAACASPWLHWLDTEELISLADGVSLVGIDNWAEEPWNQMSRKPKDWIYISDFVGLSTEDRLTLSRKLGIEAADRLRNALSKAAETSELVIAACHVPPIFGYTCDAFPYIAPWLGSSACGEVITSVAAENPDVHFVVLAGHLHSPLQWRPRENVKVRIAAAEYYDPRVEDVFDTVERVWLSQPSFGEGGKQ